MKKVLLIGIIAILAYSQVGYYFVMRMAQDRQKEQIKTAIRSTLRDNEMEIISLSDNQQQVYWEEDGSEFFFKGEMYDVVRTKKVNGKTLLYCINDRKEKSLVDHYNAITKHNSASDKKSSDNTDPSFNLFFETAGSVNIFHAVISKSRFPGFVSKLEAITLNKVSPPPQA